MRSVGLLEAWHTWSAGQPTGDLLLWKLPILWWGRIGKLAQFAGALTVILDLVGPERLRAWGRSLHRRSSQPLAQRVPGALRTIRDVFAVMFSWAITTTPGPSDDPEESERKRELLDRQERLGVGCGTLAFGLIATYAAAWLGSQTDAFGRLSTLWQVLLLLLWVAVGGPLLIALLLTVSRAAVLSVGIALDVLLARPAAAIFDTRHPGLWAKWVGVFLLVAGFHFDLLAS